MSVCLHARVAVRVLLQLATFDARRRRRAVRGRARRRLARLADREEHAVAVHAQRARHAGAHPLGLRGAQGQGRGRRRAPRRARRAARRRHQVARRRHRAAPRRRAARALFLDLAGEPLHRRGYRVAMVEAPLKETLAAAVLALGGARARRAVRRSDGRARARWPSSTRWRRAASRPGCAAASASSAGRRCRREALRAPGRGCAPRPRPPPSSAPRAALPPIVCADIDADALAAARQNAAAAGVDDAIDVRARRRRDAASGAGRSGTVVHQPALRRAPEAARAGRALPRDGARVRAPRRLARRRAVGQPAAGARDAPQAARLAPALERPARGAPAALRDPRRARPADSP